MQAGKWEFPGGKVEQGESEREALAREILEELGCEVEVGEAFTCVEHYDTDCSIRLAPFLCELRQGEPQLLEHAQHSWCSIDEFAELDWAQADIPIWQELVVRKRLSTKCDTLSE